MNNELWETEIQRESQAFENKIPPQQESPAIRGGEQGSWEDLLAFARRSDEFPQVLPGEGLPRGVLSANSAAAKTNLSENPD